MNLGQNRTYFVDGIYAGEDTTSVPIRDRAFLFGDGVYEVTAVVSSRLIDFERHIDRLYRSAEAIELVIPFTRQEWLEIHRELISRNSLEEGIVYIQVTRGAAERDFAFDPKIKPFSIAFTQRKDLISAPRLSKGVSCYLTDDLRWKRRDIKSTSLLAQVIPKQKASALGYDEALLHENGVITEGGSTSFFAMDQIGRLRTHPLSNSILPGVTRRAVIELAAECSLEVVEEAISLTEIPTLREAFVTGATYFVVPVVQIAGVAVGNGCPGPTTLALQKLYIARSQTQPSGS